MLDFEFKRKIFKIRECAFCGISELGKSMSDVVYLHSSDSGDVTTKMNVIVQKQYTLLTDLLESEDELLSKIKKNCKYEIRRSEREEVIEKNYDSEELLNNSDVVDRFEKVYNVMFSTKGLSGYRFNRELVKEGIKANSIVITTCRNANGENEIFHAYLCDQNSCVLMYSASPLWGREEKEKVNEIGRMNKYLHWKDILYFKERGLTRYEWGGISSPDEPNGIDKFKMEFGGEIVQYNNYVIPISTLGRVYTYLVRRKNSEK